MSRSKVGPATGPGKPATAAGSHSAARRRPARPTRLTRSGLPCEADGPAAAYRLVSAVRQISGGNVRQVLPSGPVFGRLPHRYAVRRDTATPLLGAGDRVMVGVLSAGWAVSLLAFWVWWLRPEHRVTGIGLAVNSLLLVPLSLMPAYFVIAVNRLRDTDPSIDIPPLRVALVVTRAPSEGWLLVRTTLTAMLAQRFPLPYHVWLCDEDPSSQILAWCQAHGVRVATRHDRADYHRATWPRRTRCKEGNLAFFYDHWGYRDYDVVAQLDCDHVPQPTYLAEMVRPFADESVGYVAAPSVCDANAAVSWSARGRLHREAHFHGPVQAGHGYGLAPVCIGSHYAVRTRALRDIGGLGPELAEDFSTAFLLNSAGWQGAFALRAEAHGDGPLTFAAMLTQEFQWSRSLVTLLYDLVPRHLRRLPWQLRLRFLYALSYYPLLALAATAGVLLPPIAAVSGLAWITVNYAEFLVRWGAVSLWIVLIAVLVRRRGLLRPPSAPILSWESWLYAFTRWPFLAWGVLAATLQKLRPRPITFRVTPKVHDGLVRLPTGLVTPYLTITAGLSGAAIIGEVSATGAVGYVGLCLLGSGSYALVTLAVPLLHAAEAARTAGVRLRTAVLATARAPLVLAVLVLVPLAVAFAAFPRYAAQQLGW